MLTTEVDYEEGAKAIARHSELFGHTDYFADTIAPYSVRLSELTIFYEAWLPMRIPYSEDVHRSQICNHVHQNEGSVQSSWCILALLFASLLGLSFCGYLRQEPQGWL